MAVSKSSRAGLESTKQKFYERQKKQPVATGKAIGNVGETNISIVNDINKSDGTQQFSYPIHLIDLKKIKPREEGNSFSLTNIENLAESIRTCGLIDPIQAVHVAESDEYRIISGHRRYEAYSRLYKEYVKNPAENIYDEIPVIVYELTEDQSKDKTLDENNEFIYITRETEQQIYEDSNLETRQLSYQEVAQYIDHIINRLEDEDYRQKIIRNRTLLKKNNSQSMNVPEEIAKVLADYNYSGWSERNIRRYVEIREIAKYDDEARELCRKVQSADEKMTVNEAHTTAKDKISFYKMLNAPASSKRNFSARQKKQRDTWASLPEENKKEYFERTYSIQQLKQQESKSKKSKIPTTTRPVFTSAKKSVKDLLKTDHRYTKKDIEEIQIWVKELQKIVDEYQGND